MTSTSRFLCFMFLIAVVCYGQNGTPAPPSNAAKHSGDSYVLVLKKQAIMRGTDFSQRALALKYGRKHHLKDFVWYATGEEHFVATDPDSIQRLKEFEKVQDGLNKRWNRDATNPPLAAQLRQAQEQHNQQRDEFVWALFDELKDKGRLTEVK